MSSRQKVGLAFIIGLLLGVVVVLAMIVLKSDKVTVLSLNESSSSEKQASLSPDKRKDSRTNTSYRYYTNPKNKNQYLEKQTSQTEKSASSSNSTNTISSFKEKIIIDLNTADTLDLQIIKGIGKVRARNIYKYGKQLGGYVNKEQLREVWGINDTVFEQISPYIVLKTKQVRTININTENIKELSFHPYIDYYLAKAIIQFRQQYGNFKNIEEIKKVHLMTEELYQKLAPYLAIK